MTPPVIFTNAADMRKFSRQLRADGKTIGFVPTMGNLHEGHISLVLAAREKCDAAIVSIYVNPTQFSKNEDFGVYPRTQEADLAKLEAAGCDAVFMPQSLYHTSGADGGMVVGAEDAVNFDAHCSWVSVDHLSQGLCASSRPHFFRGVSTVVAKLFNIVDPDVAFFGKKDFQQWRVLERMVRDLDFGIKVVGMPIQREADGLAMSSRNALLTPENRSAAPAIYKALSSARQGAVSGQVTAVAEIRSSLAAALEAAGGRVDYVEVVDALTLKKVETAAAQPTLIAIAAHFGSVRLIDNVDF